MVSQGARAKLGDLYEMEAEKLIKALKKRLEQQAAHQPLRDEVAA